MNVAGRGAPIGPGKWPMRTADIALRRADKPTPLDAHASRTDGRRTSSRAASPAHAVRSGILIRAPLPVLTRSARVLLVVTAARVDALGEELLSPGPRRPGRSGQ
jgi:hypothetical protein